MEKDCDAILADKTIKSANDLLSVSLLCGFLGAGKTTLLKHILETKHVDKNFRCAVIVNDMAALNIDKSLIDQSALVQSDEVIAMQNGCFCCTLQSDLVDQIISLTQKRQFNYMLIEASGVSEPSQIAPLFDLCDDEHNPDEPEAADHEHDPDKPQLGEVARLDTCVTVVDSAEFHSNLGSMKTYEQGVNFGTIAELLMEQVEFSNVVVLNKGDLVSEEQQIDMIDKIMLINPKVKIIKAVHSKINVRDILDTHLYESNRSNDQILINAMKTAALEKEQNEVEMLECCETSFLNTGKKCCKKEKSNIIDTGLSQVQLSIVEGSDQLTRHEKRFGITSFIYTARRPFHPGRFSALFLDPYFVAPDFMNYDDESDDEDRITEEEKHHRLISLQKKAFKRQKERFQAMGELLRSKGFLWIATSHDIIGSLQQAGNVMRLEAEAFWMCETRTMWEGNEEIAKTVHKYMKKSNGEDYEYFDRRQELVFIGQGLKHGFIQKVLDQCLLNSEEMLLGPKGWRETMSELDPIKLALSTKVEIYELDDDEEVTLRDEVIRIKF